MRTLLSTYRNCIIPIILSINNIVINITDYEKIP